MDIQSKATLDKHGACKCPHCGQGTNPFYRWYPALSCWNCRGVMWRDDMGRTIEQRGEIARATGSIPDSPEDKKRIELIPK